MNNNNNNKEGQMTHRLNTQYFSFEGKTFQKGVSSYAYVDARFILLNAKKIQVSQVDKSGMINIMDISDVCVSVAIDLLSDHSNRILVNKLGSALGCIIYLGGE